MAAGRDQRAPIDQHGALGSVVRIPKREGTVFPREVSTVDRWTDASYPDFRKYEVLPGTHNPPQKDPREGTGME